MSAADARCPEQPVGSHAADEPTEPRGRPVSLAVSRAAAERNRRAGARRRVQLPELPSRVAHREFAPADARAPRRRLARGPRRRLSLQRRGAAALTSSQGDPTR